MQIIGTRDNSMFRVPANYFKEHRNFTAGIDPTTGGPILVVDDYTDDPANARPGHKWVVDINPHSPDFRNVVERPIQKAKFVEQATQNIAEQQPVQQQQEQQLVQQQQFDQYGNPIG